MLTKLQYQWNQLKRYPPGHRFRRRFEAQRKNGQTPSLVRRLVILSVVTVLTVIGVVLIFIPGPAVLFFALAAALLAGESKTTARALDAVELQVRRSWIGLRDGWHGQSSTGRIITSVGTGLLIGLFLFGAYLLLF